MTEASTIFQDKYLNTQECGKFIKRTPGAVRNLVLRGNIPFRKPKGGRLYFIRAEIEAWIEDAPGKRLSEFRNE